MDQNLVPGKELVEDLLGAGEDWNYLRFQMAQNAITNQQQLFEQQQWFGELSKAMIVASLGKLAAGFPMSQESISKTVNDDTTSMVLDTTLEQLSKSIIDGVSKTVSESVGGIAAAVVAAVKAESAGQA